MQLIRIKKPPFVRKKSRRFSRSWIRCFRILPLIFLFVVLLAFSFYSVSQLHQDRIITYGDSQFRLDPLIDRNASSPEIWSKQFLNMVYGAQLGHLIAQESDVTCARNSTSRKSHPPCAYASEHSNLPECPPIPNALIGAQKVSAISLNLTENEVLKVAALRTQDGSWRPLDCLQRHLVAIIIPYRDRKSHLLQLLYYLHPLLQRQKLNYKIFVVEQAGNSTFNKGAIMNAAFHTILEKKLLLAPLGNICFVFHDVDMLPEDDRNLYSCSQYPRHLSVAVNEFKYELPYYELVGGVFSINTGQFLMVNGYSNLYWGWGGEDDDMGYRLNQVGLPISRPPAAVARYTMIKHVKRHPLVYRVRSKLVRTSKRRYRFDGLNTLKYRLVNVNPCYLYTNIMVDVGDPPKSIKDLQQEFEKGRYRKGRINTTVRH